MQVNQSRSLNSRDGVHIRLSPVHTSNSVKVIFDFVEATFDFVAKYGNSGKHVYR